MSRRVFNLPNLLLVRLLSNDPKPETRANVKKSLAPLFAQRLADGEWNALFQSGLDTAEKNQQLIAEGRARLALTESGRWQALAFLGIEQKPAKLTWDALKNTYLICDALELSPPTAEQRRRIAQADGLRAAILRYSFPLDIPEYPSYAQAKRALVWLQFSGLLGKPLPGFGNSPFPGKPAALMLNEMLDPDRPPEKVPDLDKVIQQLVAKMLGARRTDPAELRLALLRDRLEVDLETGPDTHDLRLDDFAAQVLQSARACQQGWLGEDKVLIFPVWEEFAAAYNYYGLDLAAFKQKLLEASQQELVRLSRLDLGGALDSEAVTASEIQHLQASFHLIQV